MSDMPATRASLLVRLRDRHDHDAWKDFVRLYAPVVYRFARHKGLQDADAADVTQDVLGSVLAAVGSFDPQQGLFRSWLFTLAHRRLYDFVARRNRQEQPAATAEIVNDVPARDEEQHWNQEYDRQLFQLAADNIRATFSDSTWQAFWRTAVDGEAGKDAAQSLGLSVAAVYLAKSRVMVKLKQEVARLQTD